MWMMTESQHPRIFPLKMEHQLRFLALKKVRVRDGMV
jgi:hypothetical protein